VNLDFVDLGRYPLDRLDSAEGRDMAGRIRAELAERGGCRLPGFLTPEGLARCLAEVEAVAPLARHSNNRYTPYYRKPDPGFPPGHPKATPVTFAVGYVARTDIPASSAFRALYESEAMLAFMRAVSPVQPVFRYSEARGSLNVTVMREGEELGWHFDANETVASILFRRARTGGRFDWIPRVRSATDPNEAGVAAVLAGRDGHHHSFDPDPGDLLLFHGRNALHRVTPIGGEPPRLIGLMSFDNVEVAPPNPASKDLMREDGAARGGR
jgi:hypothetical protein